jgi:hypothetical protein
MQQNVALILKRHPSGYNYVPMDHDPAPERQAIVDAYYAALVAQGHVLERVDGFPHRPPPMNHPKDFHWKIVSGPLAAKAA